MQVHLCLFNHAVGVRSLMDLRVFLMDAFAEMGIDATWGERLDPDRFQLFIEYFAGDFAQRIQESGVEYGIIATEFPSKHPETGTFRFNERYDNDWAGRAVGFLKVAEKAKFILSLDPRPETLALYGEFAPTRYLGVGYSPTLRAEMERLECEPDLDFSFTGPATQYRVDILNQLSKKHVVGWVPGLLSFTQRNQMLMRSRCNLCLKLTPDWPLPSFTRLMAVLHAKRPAIADVTSHHAPSQLVVQRGDIADIRWPIELYDPAQALDALASEYPAGRVLKDAWG